jgi:hypothetical protein
MEIDQIKAGDVIGTYTFVQLYGRDYFGCYLWKVKCSQCRKVLVFHVGHVAIAGKLWNEIVAGREKCLCDLLRKLDARSIHRNLYGSIRAKCKCESNASYVYFGAKGVKVCERWLGMDGYFNFLEDMGPRQMPNHALRLRKGSLEFNKDNCYWDNWRTTMDPDRIHSWDEVTDIELKPKDVEPIIPPSRLKRVRVNPENPSDFS